MLGMGFPYLIEGGGEKTCWEGLLLTFKKSGRDFLGRNCNIFGASGHFSQLSCSLLCHGYNIRKMLQLQVVKKRREAPKFLTLRPENAPILPKMYQVSHIFSHIIFSFHDGATSILWGGLNNFAGGASWYFKLAGPCTDLSSQCMGGPEGGPPPKNVRFGATWGGRPPQAPPYWETLGGTKIAENCMKTKELGFLGVPDRGDLGGGYISTPY